MAASIILLAARGAGAAGAQALTCSRRLERAAAGAARARQRVLARCVAEATACPEALGAEAPAVPDACLERAGTRCRTRLGGLSRLAARMSRVVGACLAVLDPEQILDDDLGYADLAPFCPRVPLRAGVPEDAFACQAAALACTTSAVITGLAPRMADVLLRAGVSLADAPGCVASSLCGNGAEDGDEECDDGPANSDVEPDACRTSCLEAFCGDGVVDDGEECDDHGRRDGDGCDADCVIEAGVCGNGAVDEDEECDDGNHRDGDGCDADCFHEEGTCGNGVVEGDEECDDGNPGDADGCDADCLLVEGTCGNGAVEGDEECDDGPDNSDDIPDRCRTDCTASFCGDDVLDPLHGEQCEPAGTLLCTDDCRAWTLFAATTTRRPTEALASCQRALLRTGTRCAARTRAIVGRCVEALDRCVLGRQDTSDVCSARAGRPCADAATRRDRTVAKLTTAAVERCRGRASAPVSIDALLRTDGGLGFAETAARCPFHGPASPTTDDLVACVLERARCMGERLVGITVPRAYELLYELEADPQSRFPCILDPDDLGSPSSAFADAP